MDIDELKERFRLSEKAWLFEWQFLVRLESKKLSRSQIDSDGKDTYIFEACIR